MDTIQCCVRISILVEIRPCLKTIPFVKFIFATNKRVYISSSFTRHAHRLVVRINDGIILAISIINFHQTTISPIVYHFVACSITRVFFYQSPLGIIFITSLVNTIIIHPAKSCSIKIINNRIIPILIICHHDNISISIIWVFINLYRIPISVRITGNNTVITIFDGLKTINHIAIFVICPFLNNIIS